jgi:hypothetical protein
VTLDPLREHIEFAPFTASDRKSALDVEPEQVAIQLLDSGILEERIDPRSSFSTPTESVSWDGIQVAYFTSAAAWNYLTAMVM